MKVSADGLLFHHFHGKYWASVVLEFRNSEETSAALLSKKLGDGWIRLHDDVSLAWEGDSAAVDALIEQLNEHCGLSNKRAVASLDKSIDHGEPFTIEFEAVDPRQREWRF